MWAGVWGAAPQETDVFSGKLEHSWDNCTPLHYPLQHYSSSTPPSLTPDLLTLTLQIPGLHHRTGEDTSDLISTVDLHKYHTIITEAHLFNFDLAF